MSLLQLLSMGPLYEFYIKNSTYSTFQNEIQKYLNKYLDDFMIINKLDYLPKSNETNMYINNLYNKSCKQFNLKLDIILQENSDTTKHYFIKKYLYNKIPNDINNPKYLSDIDNLYEQFCNIN